AHAPIEIELHELAHLSVRRRDTPMLFSLGQLLAKIHQTFGVRAVTERRLAQRLRQAWKQAFGRRFVVPDVRAVSETTTAVVVAALEPVERAVRDAERGRHYQRGQIR